MVRGEVAMRLTLRAAGVVGLCILVAGVARADESELPPQKARDALGSLVAGMTLFSVGTAIQAAYLPRADTTGDRFLVQAPIFGPIAVAAGGTPSSDWSTALIFSSITQSIGVIAISIAIPKLLELRQHQNK
jgi:hypothetical protein